MLASQHTMRQHSIELAATQCSTKRHSQHTLSPTHAYPHARTHTDTCILAPNARRHVRYSIVACSDVCLSFCSVVSSSHSNAGRPYHPLPTQFRLRVCAYASGFSCALYNNIGMPHSRTNPRTRACTCTRVRYECMVCLDPRGALCCHRGLVQDTR